MRLAADQADDRHWLRQLDTADCDQDGGGCGQMMVMIVLQMIIIVVVMIVVVMVIMVGMFIMVVMMILVTYIMITCVCVYLKKSSLPICARAERRRRQARRPLWPSDYDCNVG